ncbi:hypothetical protein M9H77_27434 [Catharanthus roseus]|uniref:Uncharacterized protein n=1 Tax=Catharanthus roseus TaxID=4058 RepID=A0ACC0ADG9_CATRO|nr:hypothetical protein M9H77_27434 [Catharanthus roseus]
MGMGMGLGLGVPRGSGPVYTLIHDETYYSHTRSTKCRRADLANQSFIVFNPIRLKMLGFCFPVRSDGRILSQSDNNGKMFRVSSRNISKKRERENLRKRIRDQAPIQTGSNINTFE